VVAFAIIQPPPSDYPTTMTAQMEAQGETDETGMVMIFITHDLGMVAEIADEVSALEADPALGGPGTSTGSRTICPTRPTRRVAARSTPGCPHVRLDRCSSETPCCGRRRAITTPRVTTSRT
jgi:hypothetical protein